MDATDRASQMFKTLGKNLPKLAVDYARHLGNKYGMCSEIIITAFAHYAQCIESLPCEDSLYIINDEGKAWFKQKLLSLSKQL